MTFGFEMKTIYTMGFPGSGKNSACQCRKCGFDPWIRKNLWRKNGNPLQYSFLGNPKQRTGYRPWGLRVRHDLELKEQIYIIYRIISLVINSRHIFFPASYYSSTLCLSNTRYVLSKIKFY